MADVKISDLTDGNPAVGTDLIEVERPGSPATSRKVTLASVVALASPDFGAGNAGLSYAAVGTYIWGMSSSNVNANTTLTAPGSTLAGSSLRAAGSYSHISLDDGPGGSRDSTALSGTWRCMGIARNSRSAGTRAVATLWLRIS